MAIEIEHRLTEVEDRSKSNQRRIENLEKSTEAINRLATSMEVMAEKQDRVADSVEKLDGKVTALEEKPAKRWDSLINTIIGLLAAAVVGFILAKIGL